MKLGISNLSLFDNAIINGDFNIWQRGTSFAPPGAAAYTTDRFQYHYSGTMVYTVSRVADVPTLGESRHRSIYSMKMDCTTAQVSIGAGQHCTMQHRIEGYNFASYMNKTVTLSFWVKATKTGIYCVAFGNVGFNRTYIIEYTVNSSDTWEKKEVTLTFNDGSGGWSFDHGIGICISWSVACGTSLQGAANTWLTGNFLATSNQVNACDNVANNFQLSQVQFELGSSASDFKGRTIQQELGLCQRYFCKSYPIGMTPGAITSPGSVVTEEYLIKPSALLLTPFPVPMRITPTVLSYSNITGASNNVRDIVNNVDKTILSYDYLSSDSFSGVSLTSNCVGGPPDRIAFQYTADAEL